MSENKIQQIEETEVLLAIYGLDWQKDPNIEGSYCIKLDKDVQLSITYNSEYPSHKPPSYELLAPNLTKYQKQDLNTAFEEIYRFYFFNYFLTKLLN